MPEKFTYVNGHIVRYLDVGPPNSKILIVLQGFGGFVSTWSKVIPVLSEYYRVIIPDIVGLGYSDKPTVEYTMDFLIDFLDEFLSNLQISKTSIVGSSFGGHLATEFAIRYNRMVDKLVLASPAGMMRTSTPVLDSYIMAALYPTHDNAAKALKDMVYNPNVVDEGVIIDFVNTLRLPKAKYAFMSILLGLRYARKLQGRLSDITAPTLVVWGNDDRMISADYARHYNEIPKMWLEIIDYCGHILHLEKPIEFSEIILRFLGGGYDQNRIYPSSFYQY